MEGYVRFSAHGLVWDALPEFVEAVKSDPRCAETGECFVVKSGPARLVWRFDVDATGYRGEVYVKNCLVPGLADRFKYAFRRAKAVDEFKTLIKLGKKGLAVPRPLAVGVARRGAALSGSILITESLGDVLPLDVYFEGHIDSVGRAEAAAFSEAFARFVRGVHDEGVLQRDFHAGNIMVGGEPAAPQFALVDLYGVRARGALSMRARLSNLAVIGHFFCRVAPRHWRARFLKEYLGGGDYRAAARFVERRAARGMRRIWRGRDARILGDNKYFRHVRVGGLLGHRRREKTAVAAVKLFADGDPLEKADRILKDTRSSKVGVVAVEVDGETVELLIKRRNGRRSPKGVLDTFRLSRGKSGFYFGAAFAVRHLPTPRVYAALDERCGGCLAASYLVMEFVEGADTLGDVLAGGLDGRLWEAFEKGREDLSRRLARTLRRMHWCGFSMRDLKAANILLFECEGGIDFTITDLDAAQRFMGGVPERFAMKNLARLYFDAAWLGVTRREAILFLKAYLGPSKRERIARWVSAIGRVARKKRRTFKPKGVFARE
jgi:tRNA A-37 threonylcarbamoyl transferase component Bud32